MLFRSEGRIKLPGGGFHPYDSSFSGLKTAVRRTIERLQEEKPDAPLPVADLAASFQEAVARALTKRALRCAEDLGLTKIAVGGGVAANSRLRSRLQEGVAETGIDVLFPPLKFCTDNAAMIGCAAVEHLQRGQVSPTTLSVRSRLALSDVGSLYA